MALIVAMCGICQPMVLSIGEKKSTRERGQG
jgi:hypothetical protein